MRVLLPALDNGMKYVQILDVSMISYLKSRKESTTKTCLKVVHIKQTLYIKKCIIHGGSPHEVVAHLYNCFPLSGSWRREDMPQRQLIHSFPPQPQLLFLAIWPPRCHLPNTSEVTF